MDISDRTNRTWLCSVIFMDIIGYSIRSVSDQAAIKRRFNDVLAESLQSSPQEDRILLDTGDGAAVCFLGDPEDSLFAALSLSSAFTACDDGTPSALQVRVGVNLGPIKLVRDLNGNLNAIGDGINVAQRVMSFAEPNKVLVSRSFFEVVGCLSDEYNGLFQFDGVRKDKHVREHTVYQLEVPASGMLLGTRSKARPAAALATALPESAVARIQALAQEILGPIAATLARKEASQASSVEDLVARMAAQMPEGPERDRFLAGSPALREQASAQRPPSGALQVDAAALEKLLAEEIGPLAKVLVKRAIAAAGNGRDLIEILAVEIADPKAAAVFREKAARLL